MHEKNCYRKCDSPSDNLATIFEDRQETLSEKRSIYDDITRFRYMELCSKNICECRKFHQRKDCVIIDPLFCSSCIKIVDDFTFTSCMYHTLLTKKILGYDLCKNCLAYNAYCKPCVDELDK